MESVAALRSFHCAVGTVTHLRSLLDRPGMVPIHCCMWTASHKPHIHDLTIGGHLTSSPVKRRGKIVSSVKTSEATAKTDVLSDIKTQGSLEKKKIRSVTFPSGFEALMLEVCGETDVAELKLKVGDFEMHLKRNIGGPKVVSSLPMVESPSTPPPIPSKPMVESAAASATLTSPSISSTEKTSPFTNVSLEKSSKLAALEASGSNAYVIVSSPTVGSFRRGRTVKGKKQPPSCKEGDVIKEGQVIGFLDQFGTELPVKSDVAGEVLKLLFDDGEAVGYGDPLIAVLPSFHGIQ